MLENEGVVADTEIVTALLAQARNEHGVLPVQLQNRADLVADGACGVGRLTDGLAEEATMAEETCIGMRTATREIGRRRRNRKSEARRGRPDLLRDDFLEVAQNNFPFGVSRILAETPDIGHVAAGRGVEKMAFERVQLPAANIRPERTHHGEHHDVVAQHIGVDPIGSDHAAPSRLGHVVRSLVHDALHVDYPHT